MDAEKSVTTIDRHEWTLKSPAHYTQVEQAVAVAEADRTRLASKGIRTEDVHVYAAEDQVVIAFEAARPKNPKRYARGFASDEAEAADV